LPLVIVLLSIINLYLRKDEIFKQEKFIDMVKNFIPKNVRYIVLLIVITLSSLIAYYLTYLYFGSISKAIKLTVLLLLIFPAAFIDYKKQIIPNAIILAGFFMRVLIYIFELIADGQALLEVAKLDFLGCIFAGGLFLLSGIISKNSVGMGDVKLFAVIGIFSGFRGAFGAVFFTLFVSFFFSIFLLVTRKKTRKDYIAFAPLALIGTFIMIVLGSN